jgi:hypothetical protein
MKPLILTFFIILLCYSLFTRNKEPKPEPVPVPVPVLVNKGSLYREQADRHKIKQLQSVDSLLFINYQTVGAGK